ncbi:hypothetical protein IOD06_09215 [Psychrobacter sp. N25K4-3-2]|uniref:hypothetical protein n=1 Tax=Psychrobacter sp. N25K4-3-2 TaxID=2785026 RepID=UPI00188B9C11|nr:hypothetical protein [Psychrobacter sp. N25K4-3-2]MBF4490068.1 hypothetical protein [Psychrobacter sp. N25K4-3-2]
MINIEKMTINIDILSTTSNRVLDTEDPLIVRDELVSMLRIISKDERFSKQTVVIPDNCGQYGFAEGEFNLPELLYFLADMLE